MRDGVLHAVQRPSPESSVYPEIELKPGSSRNAETRSSNSQERTTVRAATPLITESGACYPEFGGQKFVNHPCTPASTRTRYRCAPSSRNDRHRPAPRTHETLTSNPRRSEGIEDRHRPSNIRPHPPSVRSLPSAPRLHRTPEAIHRRRSGSSTLDHEVPACQQSTQFRDHGAGRPADRTITHINLGRWIRATSDSISRSDGLKSKQTTSWPAA